MRKHVIFLALALFALGFVNPPAQEQALTMVAEELVPVMPNDKVIFLAQGSRPDSWEQDTASVVYQVPDLGGQSHIRLNDSRSGRSVAKYVVRHADDGTRELIFKDMAYMPNLNFSSGKALGWGNTGTALAGMATIAIPVSEGVGGVITLASLKVSGAAIGVVLLELIPPVAVATGITVSVYYLWRGVSQWARDCRSYWGGVMRFSQWICRRHMMARIAAASGAAILTEQAVKEWTDGEVADGLSRVYSQMYDDVEMIRMRYDPHGPKPPKNGPGLGRWFTATWLAADYRFHGPMRRSIEALYEASADRVEREWSDFRILLGETLQRFGEEITELDYTQSKLWIRYLREADQSLLNTGREEDVFELFMNKTDVWEQSGVVPQIEEVKAMVDMLRGYVPEGYFGRNGVMIQLMNFSYLHQGRIVADVREFIVSSDIRSWRLDVSREELAAIESWVSDFRSGGYIVSNSGTSSVLWGCDQHPNMVLKVINDPAATVNGPEAEVSWQLKVFAEARSEGDKVIIPEIFFAFEDGNGNHIIAMERLTGYCLAELLKMRQDGRPLPDLYANMTEADVLRMRQDIFDFVFTSMHRDLGCTHQDFSPWNVMATRVGGTYCPALIDFGKTRGIDELVSPEEALAMDGIKGGQVRSAFDVLLLQLQRR